METHSVELGGITLHGFAEVDPFVGLMVSRINGWRGLSGARGDNDPIPGGFGSYASTRVLREERSIELVGAAVAESERAATAMLDALDAAVGGVPVLMTVHDADGAWSRMVEVQGIQITGAWNRDRIIFAIDAIANDPRRYRAAQTVGPVGLAVQTNGLRLPERFPWSFGTKSGGSLEVENTGSVPLLPVVSVTGGFSRVTISDKASGRQIQFGAVATSGVLVFDSRDRRAFLNGRDVTREMLRRGWFEIPAGALHRFEFECAGVVGNPMMQAEFKIGAF